MFTKSSCNNTDIFCNGNSYSLTKTTVLFSPSMATLQHHCYSHYNIISTNHLLKSVTTMDSTELRAYQTTPKAP